MSVDLDSPYRPPPLPPTPPRRAVAKPSQLDQVNALSERLHHIRATMGREDFYPSLLGWITSAAASQPTETVTAALTRFADCMEEKVANAPKSTGETPALHAL